MENNTKILNTREMEAHMITITPKLKSLSINRLILVQTMKVGHITELENLILPLV